MSEEIENPFVSFNKIESMGRAFMVITEKIHGTNAQIYIYPNEEGVLQLKAGSRNRWLMPDEDNYGFASFVYENKEDIIEKLGEGRHFGEWAGNGINSGYDLPEKRLYLFNWKRFSDSYEFPNRIDRIPFLYSGAVDMGKIQEVMEELKTNGSLISPGYMKPEGVVVEMCGRFFKKTFSDEEVKWSGNDKVRISRETIDISYLLQPLRLEKLLSKDSKYREDYPSSLSMICKAYIQDLNEEDQFKGTEEEITEAKRILPKVVFGFIKEIINAQ